MTTYISRSIIFSPLVLAALLLIPASGAAENSSDNAESDSDTSKSVEKIAKNVQNVYKKTKDFQAEFKQIYHDQAAGEKKTNHGEVYFKKPGKMRWDYYKTPDSDDRKKLIVSDGSDLWIYEYKFKQVFKKCLQKSQLPTALTFLMGGGNLLEDFDIEKKSDTDKTVLLLTPKKSTSKYKKVAFQIDPETYRVVKTTIYDPYGNRNIFDFSSIKVNENLPDDGFNFSPPEDARLLNPNKTCE